MATTKCIHCGKMIPVTIPTCPECGAINVASVWTGQNYTPGQSIGMQSPAMRDAGRGNMRHQGAVMRTAGQGTSWRSSGSRTAKKPVGKSSKKVIAIIGFILFVVTPNLSALRSGSGHSSATKPSQPPVQTQPTVSYDADEQAETEDYGEGVRQEAKSDTYYCVDEIYYYFFEDLYSSLMKQEDKTGWYVFDEKEGWGWYCDEEDYKTLGDELWYRPDSYAICSQRNFSQQVSDKWGITDFSESDAAKEAAEAKRQFKNR